MGAEATALHLLTRPWFPQPLAKALVRAFAVWRVRQLARADRDARVGELAAETLDRAVYLLDGYHGGIPFWDWLLLAGGGLWEALLWPAVGEVVVGRAQRSGLPAVLELDGHTFSVMAAQQPQALARLREAVVAGTIEVVNGTYAQPFLGTLSGESVLRQFCHGLAAAEAGLGVSVTSYASQEPCFCAQLPQILAGFGIERALVRTHWAPFGAEAALDAPLVRWEGPDGSSVLAVPRHTWMDYSTRQDLHPGALRGNLTSAHASRWTAAVLQLLCDLASVHGTEPALLSKLEDLSPTESPTANAARLADIHNVHLSTLAGYCRAVLEGGAVDDLPAWQPTPDHLPLTLPWGLEGDVLMRARDQAEAALLVAERADAVAHALGADSRARQLHGAWERLLLAQHHDLQVCGPWLSRAHGGPMSAAGCELCAGAAEAADDVLQDSLSHLLARVDTTGFAGRPVLVFNPEARPRKAVVCVPPGVAAAEPGTDAGPVGSGLVFDGGQALAAQATDKGLAFVCDLPALGWRVFDLRAGKPDHGTGQETAFEFGNEFYQARLNADGALTISVHGRVLLEGGATLGVWREGRWWESGEGGAECRVLADGPVLAHWRVGGSIGGIDFKQDLLLYRGLPRIEATVTLDFGSGVHFGPELDDGAGYYAQDGRKLCIRFPLARGGRAVRQVPFLVAETAQSCFSGCGWAAVEQEGLGLAVLAPGARGYTYDVRTGLLQRVLAWSPRSYLYASDDSVTPGGSRHTTLRGRHTFHYGLLPYHDRAEAVAESARTMLRPAVVAGQPSAGDLAASGSLLSVEPDGVELSALFVRDGATYARVWNPSDAERQALIQHSGRGDPMAVGFRSEEGERLAGGRVSLRPWGVQTVRLWEGKPERSPLPPV